MKTLAILGAAVALAIGAGGCGLQHAAPGGPVRFAFTAGFGSKTLGSATLRLSSSLDAAAATAKVRGKLVAPSGQEWTLFVNGIVPPTTPATTPLHAGDRVWWDLHPTAAGATLRAAVGAYPEPFVHGANGKRLPATVECADDVAPACADVRDALARVGVPKTYQVLGTGSGTDSLGVVVGTAIDLSPEVVAALIDRGPTASGVFARFAAGGRTLELLDSNGRVGRVLGGPSARGPAAAVGLIAATGDGIAEPDWVVSGTDPEGVAAAAKLLARDPGALAGKLAVAVAGERVIALPLSVR